MRTPLGDAKPGWVLIHAGTGGVAILDRRKADDSGWWIQGGGGLADFAYDEGDWLVLSPEAWRVVRRCVFSGIGTRSPARGELA